MPAPSAYLAALFILVFAGCRPSSKHPPTPLPATSSPPPSAAASASATSPLPLTSASAGPSPRRGDGCWGNPSALPAEERLLSLGQRCAQGMTALPPSKLSLASGESTVEVPALPAGVCLRVFSAHQGLLELTLLDAQGAPLARDAGLDFALLNPAGPRCLRQTEKLRLRLRGQGEAWLQLWTSPPDPAG